MGNTSRLGPQVQRVVPTMTDRTITEFSRSTTTTGAWVPLAVRSSTTIATSTAAISSTTISQMIVGAPLRSITAMDLALGTAGSITAKAKTTVTTPLNADINLGF